MGKYLVVLILVLVLATPAGANDPWWKPGLTVPLDYDHALPNHPPPFTCQELFSMSYYGEWSHRDQFRYPTVNKAYETKWVNWYQRIRPMILAACQEEQPYMPPPLDPIIESPL